MKQADVLRKFALSLPETDEADHFERTSYRIRKKIFVSYEEKTNRATLKLSLTDQDIFSTIDEAVIYPVPNKWGKKGWTYMELDKKEDEVLIEIVRAAYCEVAPKKLGKLVISESKS